MNTNLFLGYLFFLLLGSAIWLFFKGLYGIDDNIKNTKTTCIAAMVHIIMLVIIFFSG